MLDKALDFYGETEFRGTPSNLVILEIINTMFPKWRDDSTISWCSIFLNFIANLAGYEKSGSAVARSWLKVGEKIDEPEQGDIVVFWRESKRSWKGHASIFVRETDTHIWCLGGNQANAICIKKYSKSRVLGYRRLSKLA